MVTFSSSIFANNQLWQPHTFSQRSEIPQQGVDENTYYQLDGVMLRQLLARAEYEGSTEIQSEIELPVSQGEIQRFKLVESPIMAPELAARYPEIKNYKVYGIDDPYSSGRLSISPQGFSGMIRGPSGSFYIEPVDSQNGTSIYRGVSNILTNNMTPFNCGVESHQHENYSHVTANRTSMRTAGSLRVYRLAIAATSEYVAAVGGTKASTLIEVNKAINRVNEIYEVDLGVRLVLVGNTDDLFYTGIDPYTNDSGFILLDENQMNIDNVIGASNYDIGHVLSTGGGGVASVGSVCGTNKAEGVTGSGVPTGENFYIDFIAHEMGHQFNAEHSFNGTTGSCSGNRSAAFAFEPGSGSTIMSYAGICKTALTDGENISRNADAMFHAGSIRAIDTFTTTGAGSNCGSLSLNSNPNEPVANAGSDFTIPRRTPFILTASASDIDGDPLVYSWDQMDTGTETSLTTLGFDLNDNSLFRSYLPQSSNQRHFPALGTTINNQFDDSEVLACTTRSLNFRLSVRDGKSGMGTDDVRVNVTNSAGPFKITSHNTTQVLAPGLVQFSWDVANTNTAPVNCTNVDISLLTFNAAKTTYVETSLVSGEINDGSAVVTVPNKSSSRARLKIQCSNNIFYDISDADLVVTGAAAFTGTESTVAYNTSGANLTLFTVPAETCGDDPVVPVPSSSEGGGGAVNIIWLAILMLISIVQVAGSNLGNYLRKKHYKNMSI